MMPNFRGKKWKTGSRRNKIKRLCACGCGQKFTTTFPEKLYKNVAHKQAAFRMRVTTRDVKTGVFSDDR